MPLLERAGHTFSAWACTVGGILQANGIKGFLGNYAERRTVDDPLRSALGQLACETPDQWRDPSEWLRLAVHLGLVEDLMAKAERRTPERSLRALGKVMSRHEQETFAAEVDDGVATFRLEARNEAGSGPAVVQYRFRRIGWREAGEAG